MKNQFEPSGECEATLTVEAEPASVESAMRRAARHLADRTTIPGFRKGKAPYAVVLNHFGQEAVLEEAIDLLGPELYRQALDERKVDPAAAGSLEEVVSREPLVLRFSVPLPPEITLGPYRSVRLPFEDPSVEEAQVDRVLENLRQSQSVLEPVDRPARKGDILLAKFDATILSAEGKTEAVSTTAQDAQAGGEELELNDDLGGRFPGAGAQMEGLRAGETREVDYLYPDSFPVEKLRGRPAHLLVQCSAVKERRVPDWSEELVRAVSDHSTLDELRADIREALQAQERAEVEHKYAREVLDRMIAGGSVRFPAVMLREEMDRLIRNLESNLQREGVTLQVYLKTRPGGRESLTKELEPQARQRLVRGLYLAELAKSEHLAVGDDEVRDRYKETFAKVPGATDQAQVDKAVKDPTLFRLFFEDLLNDKAVRRVAEIGQGTAPELPLESGETPSPTPAT